MKSFSPARIKVLRAALTGAFAIVTARAAQVAIHPDPRLARLGDRQYSSEVELAAKRGTIYDRRGNILAQSVEVDSIYGEPRKLEQLSAADHRKLVSDLARALKEPERVIAERLDSDRGFVWLKRRVSPEMARAVAAIDVPGIGSVRESKRFYPNVELAGHVTGFSGLDSEGLEGLEKQYDGVLKSDAKRFERPRDARGRLYAGDDVFVGEEETGEELVLTIDQQIQYLAEKALKDGVQNSGASAGFLIVEDPKTGEILAMAGQPSYNPNAFWQSRPEKWRNRPVTDVFEPGSTLKPVLMSAAIEAGVVKPDDPIFCENGSIDVADLTIRDSKKHGWLTASRVLAVSSNIGMIKIGRLLGKDAYLDALGSFGFGSKTGIDLPGEAGGIVAPRKRWSTVTLASSSFGHGIGVTGIQLESAIAAIANGGVRMRPYVVRQVRSPDGVVLRDVEPQELGQVVSRATADTVTKMMVGVVSPDGTGAAAALPEYTVAGKTGTAQKPDPIAGGYSDKRIASFVGFAPATHPRLVILVVIDEPKTSPYGGVVAAPIFREVADESLRYLGVAPDRDGPAITLPSVGDDQVGEGSLAERVTVSPKTAADRAAKLGAARALAAQKAMDFASDPAQTPDGVMPDFRGLSVRAALRVAEPRSFEIEVDGSGRALRQTPEPGSKAAPGDKVKIWFGRDRADGAPDTGTTPAAPGGPVQAGDGSGNGSGKENLLGGRA